MQTYSVRDVERVLRLSRSTIRALITTGFVKPQRDKRRQYLFSFQDLIVLRAARALIEAKVPRQRINRSLEDLRKHLPDTVPLSGLSISAVGERVVVRTGQSRLEVASGQYLLGLDVSVEDGKLQRIELKPAAPKPAADSADVRDWFEEALHLETADPRAAGRAYERAVNANPHNSAAWINWGRLLHEQGGKRDAEKVYRQGLKRCGPEPLLMFNLGVLLEDLGRTAAALEAYQIALGKDPTLADCHYNLARLYEALGKAQHAIRHLGQYRRLMTG